MQQNVIFLTADGFAFGALRIGSVNSMQTLRIPTPLDIDFTGEVAVKVANGEAQKGRVLSFERLKTFWLVKFQPLTNQTNSGIKLCEVE
ncbi:MAG TPA: hypothetical protein DDW52_09500 [Planctomycetaceae bacterium]|nr:hypothetical protein [Planctomycetaceae bacterium]